MKLNHAESGTYGLFHESRTSVSLRKPATSYPERSYKKTGIARISLHRLRRTNTNGSQTSHPGRAVLRDVSGKPLHKAGRRGGDTGARWGHSLHQLIQWITMLYLVEGMYEREPNK